jgi:hypothetical protein
MNLKKWGVPRRAGSSRYFVRSNLFDDTSDEYVAYFIGYIAADGSITKESKFPNKQYRITISSKDIDILEKFRHFVNAGCKTITGPTKKGVFSFSISSDALAYKLISYGVTPRKSHSLQIKDNKLINSKHFWRGLIDGDGSLYWASAGHYPGLIITSCSNAIVNQFELFLKYHELPIGKNRVRISQWNAPCNQYRVNGKRAVQITNFLYINAKVYLDRKYLLALKFTDRYAKKEVLD